MNPENSISPDTKQSNQTQAKDTFPWALLGSTLTCMAAAHFLGTELWGYIRKVEEHPGFFQHALPWAVFCAAATALVTVSFYLHRTRYGFNYSKVAATLTLLCVQFFGAGLHHLLPSNIWMLILSALVLITGLGITHSMHRAGEAFVSLSGPTLALEYCKERPLDALIIFVSLPNLLPTPSSSCGWRLEGKLNDIPILPIDFTKEINTDIQLTNGLRWNWQQLLRTLQPHIDENGLGIPKDIVLLGTEADYLNTAREFTRSYARGCNVTTRDPLSFEDFNQVIDTLKKIIHEFPQHREDRIGVDVTGGMKIPSIAGAVLTLNRACVIQYVQTVPPNTALIYDLRRSKASTPET